MIKLKSVKEIASFLKSRGETLKPLSLSEIQKVENHFNVLFPSEYKDFLLLMGKSAGRFMEGSSVFIDELYSLQSWGMELCEENGLTAPENAFVFYMHQGYKMAYFINSDDSNPQVYYFEEGMTDFIDNNGTLVDFYLKQLEFVYPEG